MAWVKHFLVIHFVDGHVVGETKAFGPVRVENNEDGHVLGETKVVGNVLGEIEADGPLYEDTNFVGPVLEERDDENNIGSEKVGRFVNAYSNDITTDIAKNDEDDYRELCVKKGKKLFFDGKGEVPRIELGDFKGDLLAAVGRDGNSQILLVAWVAVEVENRETWAWFLEHIQTDLETGDRDRFTIFSYLQKGLLEEIKMILPNVEHRFCAQHMYANWKKENSGHDMQQLFWECCKALTESKQTHESTSSQPTAIDVSQPHGPNPSQPATTDVSQPPAPSSSQPATSQVSQPRFPKSENTSTRTKTKASC
ncbi:hypothetical protein V6N13_118521 [Hibiscus sabdariffa]